MLIVVVDDSLLNGMIGEEEGEESGVDENNTLFRAAKGTHYVMYIIILPYSYNTLS